MTDIAADRARLLEIVRAKAIVHGRVTLSSGKEADYYVDLRRITLDGEAGPLVGRVMLDLVADLDFDAVGGLTLGADPVATAMLHAAAAAGGRLDAFVVRKAGKAHGLQQRIEGPSIEGRRVLVVEDTSTTGASPLDAARAAQEAGATVVAVATIADRATGAAGEVRGCRVRVPPRRSGSRTSAWPEPSALGSGQTTGPSTGARHDRHSSSSSSCWSPSSAGPSPPTTA